MSHFEESPDKDHKSSTHATGHLGVVDVIKQSYRI